MKKATFVYNPRDIKPKYPHPWRQPGGKTFNSNQSHLSPARSGYLRREFAPAGAQVRVEPRARYFELYINGSRVGRGLRREGSSD